MEIRDAVDSDWPDLWRIVQPIVAAGDTYCWPRDTSEEAAKTWWMGKPGGRVLVAVDHGVIVGTAEIHPNQPAAGSHVANAGFMVAPSAAGRGVGRALANRALHIAAEIGYLAMQFNAVVETNTSAIQLWESLGLTIIATVPKGFQHPGRGLVGLHIMHKLL